MGTSTDKDLDIVFVCTNLHSVRDMDGHAFDNNNVNRVEKRLMQAFKIHFDHVPEPAHLTVPY